MTDQHKLPLDGLSQVRGHYSCSWWMPPDGQLLDRKIRGGEVQHGTARTPIPRLCQCACKCHEHARPPNCDAQSTGAIGRGQPHREIRIQMRIKDLLHRIAVERWDRDLAMGQAERAQACMLARRVRSSRKDRPHPDRPELSNFATHHRTTSLDAVDQQSRRVLLDATSELRLRRSRCLGVRPQERLHQIRVAREALDPDRTVADGFDRGPAGVPRNPRGSAS